jgi:hypothetical protein
VRDEIRSAFVLAGEDEDRIAFADVLATIHRLLRVERERIPIANLALIANVMNLSANLIGQKPIRNAGFTAQTS